MRPESLTLLWDARRAAERVQDFVAGRTKADYDADIMLRSAVDRQFGIVGEALSRLGRLDPAIAAKVPDFADIVGFRNVLVHGYASIDDNLVWISATTKTGPLIEALTRLLDSAAESPA